MLIYMDNCALARLDDPPRSSKVVRQQLALSFLLAAIERGEIRLVCSTWSYDEAAACDDPARVTSMMRRLSFASEILDAADTLPQAEMLMRLEPRAPYRLREKDAFHLAAALTRNVDYFVTADDRVWRWGKGHAKLAFVGKGRVVLPQDLVWRLRNGASRDEEE